MATNRVTSSQRPRSDSIQSYGSLWEKIPVANLQTHQDAPFADVDEDPMDQYPSIDDFEPFDSDADVPSASPITPPTPPIIPSTNQSQVWEHPTTQDHLTIIVNDDPQSNKLRRAIQDDLSRIGFKWAKEEEELRPWRFGLTAIRLQFPSSRTIDIQKYCLYSRVPIWLKLKREPQKQKAKAKDNTSEKPIRHRIANHLNISLRYGAFLELNQFRYSPSHSWNNEDTRWAFILDDQRNNKGCIEWFINNLKVKLKKQLLVTNINDCVVVDFDDEGFNIYIWQKYNMNEFQAKPKENNNDTNDNRPGRVERRNSEQHRSRSRSHDQRKSMPQPNSRPRPPPPLVPLQNNKNNQQPSDRPSVDFDSYQRVGFHPPGCYFPVIQFSVRINRLNLRPNAEQNTRKQIKQTLITLVDFFRVHNIPICYGKIDSERDPHPHLFFEQNLPNFRTLIGKYSWQLLSTNGYRLQLRINQEFIQSLQELDRSEKNAEELLYHVCVYLSRMFSLKPFLDINQELQHAIEESKRKRDNAPYGMIRKLDYEGDNAVYVPSVTITPTTIRVKPLKLCRTNRVLRTTEVFGKAVEHFILVDIRDENGQELLSFHFRDLHDSLLRYLNIGFTLMGDDRPYKFLHHSSSQLRERQFWFYHHDPNGSNYSFSKAYEWMGDFSKELIVAKHAARIGLCFSTTTATVKVPIDTVETIKDIKTRDGKLNFTDGCGTMSFELREKIRRKLRTGNEFSAVQLRYDGAKGVVSVCHDMPEGIDLCIRPSMKKFNSDHDCFEVCKLSAPRPSFLNRQAIMLLSYRKVPDASFIILQQQNHLELIRALLRNTDAEKLILQKVPKWFLPQNIQSAHIDYIHEPFFRQLLISACLQSVRELLRRTRIRVPVNEGRNMIGIVDEYNVLKPDEVFVQYTILDRDSADNCDEKDKRKPKTNILDNRTVVITKNPCHHPGDIRTFTAVRHPKLEHLKDVIVFSQQGKRPAPHDISGSDLDGDEYLVIWLDHLVPQNTPNAEPYDYDANTPQDDPPPQITRDLINKTILKIAEQDCIGSLSNLHLAFADKFGLDDTQRRGKDVLSTVELAGAISQEVDSAKSGFHPLNEAQIRILNNFLEKSRPDYIDKPHYQLYKSKHVLGKLFWASTRTLKGWNRLLRYHRHLRHLQVRTSDEPEEDLDDNEETDIKLNQLSLDIAKPHKGVYDECTAYAKDIIFIYRQEMLEILNLYGLSHESDLWCRNSTAGTSGELEDTAYAELEQLTQRTRNIFHLKCVSYCDTDKCHADTIMTDLCPRCIERQQGTAMACYEICYNDAHAAEQAPILSLSWLFATPLLQHRLNQVIPLPSGLLITAIDKNLQNLIDKKKSLRFNGEYLQFQKDRQTQEAKAEVDMTVFAFIEILEARSDLRRYPRWPSIISRFVRKTPSFQLRNRHPELTDDWLLISRPPDADNYELYCVQLLSINLPENDERIHEYFQTILDICFEEGRQTQDADFLEISEKIILILQCMAINEIIF